MSRPSGRDAEFFEDQEATITQPFVSGIARVRRASRDAEVFEEDESAEIVPSAVVGTLTPKSPIFEGDLARLYPMGKTMDTRTPSGRDMEFFEEMDDDERMTIAAPKIARIPSGRDEEFDIEGDGQEALGDKVQNRSTITMGVTTHARRSSGRDAEFDEDEVPLSKAPLSREYTSRQLRNPSGRDVEYFCHDDVPRKRRASRDAELFDDDEHVMPPTPAPQMRLPSGRDAEF